MSLKSLFRNSFFLDWKNAAMGSSGVAGVTTSPGGRKGLAGILGGNGP